MRFLIVWLLLMALASPLAIAAPAPLPRRAKEYPPHPWPVGLWKFDGRDDSWLELRPDGSAVNHWAGWAEQCKWSRCIGGRTVQVMSGDDTRYLLLQDGDCKTNNYCVVWLTLTKIR